MKKLLLFLTLALFVSYTSLSQVPTNDLIENATEITTQNFVDNNVRLDLTTPSAGGQNGCNLVSFNVVYYKFTTTSSVTVTSLIINEPGSASGGNIFGIFYSAPNLNITSETDLTVVSACQFGQQSSFNSIAGQSYYLLVHRDTLNSLSRIQVTIPEFVPASERAALMDIYNSTDGPNWNFSANWNTNEPESSWSGVTVENGHVVSLSFLSQGLNGILPSSLTNLSFLVTANFNTNNLFGEVPDLSTINTLIDYQISNNLYTFSDIETHFTNNSTISNFLYNNQKPLEDELIIDAIIGNDYNLTITPVSGTNLQYQWYRERVAIDIDDIIVSGATNTSYDIINTQENDLDNYTCYVTSPTIPDLTLKRSVIKLRGSISQSEKDALIAIYNALDGPNWANNTNWLSNEHVDEWRGVVTTGNKITGLFLNFQNLNGQLPDEIGDLIHLQELRVSINANLTGPIPSTIGNLTELTWLRLQGNGHSGDLPASIGNLTNLKRLYLQNNSFTGTLPTGLGNATQMFQIFIENNQFEGEIPSSFSNFSELVSFSLANNNFSGTLPTQLEDMSSLLLIDLSNNNFEGSLPNWQAINSENTSISINNNKFQFGDIEPNHASYSNFASYIFSPQQKTSEDTTQFITIGEDVTLNANVTGANNTYQWYWDDLSIIGETNATLNLNNFQAFQFGIYRCDITNSVVTGLTLQTGNIILGEDPTTSPDYDALVAFYNATNGDNWTNNTNWLDTNQPLSTWFGITETNGRVTQIVLNSNNLNGTIAPEVTTMTALTNLSMQNNNLSGEIPSNIGDLTNLEFLLLWNNNPNLQFSKLSGNIPASIINCTNLQFFAVGGHNLDGVIPDITSLTNLSLFFIENNKFQFGDFENEFTTYQTNIGGNFSFTPQQQIQENQNTGLNISESVVLQSHVSGTQNIYSWFKRIDENNSTFLSNIQDLNLTINSVNDYGSYFYQVQSNLVPGLVISSTDIVIGPDPSTHPDYNDLVALYNATNGDNWTRSWDLTTPIHNWDPFRLTFDAVTDRVDWIDLTGNNLTGTLPPEIGNMTSLTRFQVFGNDLTGEVPSEIWNLTNLEYLWIGGQNSRQLLLSGGIPPQISNMTNLFWLNLSWISLTSPLQPELFNIPSLELLRLAECGLTGTLPSGLSTIDNVIVNGNDYEGAIPTEILNSTGNSSLRLSNNFFDFSDLEPLVLANNYTTLGFSPQRTRDVEQTVNSNPGDDIVLDVNDTDINRDVENTAMNNEYQWFKDDVAITGANQSTYTIFNAQPSDSGVYFCEITNTLLPGLIITRADITVNVGTLDIDDDELNTLKIYPNPTKNSLNIKFNNTTNGNLIMYDISGRIVMMQKIEQETETLNMQNLESGVYLLQIKTDNKTITKRIIKQ